MDDRPDDEAARAPIRDRDITAPEVLSVLRAIELGGRHETTHRIKQRIGQAMRYAVATGRADRDVTADLRGALTAPTSRHHPAIIEPAAVGELLRAIEGFSGNRRRMRR